MKRFTKTSLTILLLLAPVCMIQPAHASLYKYYKYTFSGKFQQLLPGMTTTSYEGSVIAGRAPAHKIKTFKLNVGGLTSGWVSRNQGPSYYWTWDRPQGKLRWKVQIATPWNSQTSPGRASISISGPSATNSTYSLNNKLTTAPVKPAVAYLITKKTKSETDVLFDLKKTAPPINAVYPGVSLDILGIKPGMSLKAAKSIMASYYKAEPSSYPLVSLKLPYKNVIFVNSLPYTSELYYNNKNSTDTIAVYFGNQSTGNSVVAIDRTLTFGVKTAPKISTIIAALDKKYGPQTQNPGETDSWHWVFGKHGLLKSCTKNGCPCDVSHVDVATYWSLKKDMSSDEYACVDAMVKPTSLDHSRAATLEVLINDPADKALTRKEANKQMHAAAVTIFAKEVKPEKLPKL